MTGSTHLGGTRDTPAGINELWTIDFLPYILLFGIGEVLPAPILPRPDNPPAATGCAPSC